MQNFGFCLQDLSNSSSPKLLDKILRYCTDNVHGMCYSSLFKWWRHLYYWLNNSQIKFEHSKFDANFENLLLQNCSQNSLILHTNSPWVCVIKVCSNGGSTYIIGKLIAKDNLIECKPLKVFSKTTQQIS